MMLLLTGATGFLGSHLLRRLVKDYNVVILKRSFSDTKRISDLLDKVKSYDIDLVPLENVFKSHNIDCIIHAATEYARAGVTVYQQVQTNVAFPVQLAELGINHKVKTFINIDTFFTKQESYSNLATYSFTKKSLVKWLELFSADIQVISAVLEHVYGPYDSGTKFIEGMIQKIAVEKVNRVALTSGLQKRDFVYVDDVVEAFACLVEHSKNSNTEFQSFEVGTGQSVTVKEMVQAIKELSGSNAELSFGEIPMRGDEIMDSFADIELLKRLGWEPKVSFKDGVAKILDCYSA